MGLCNSPATLQRVMQEILGDTIGRCCFVYLDDIVVFGGTLDQHEKNVDEVLRLITKAGFRIQAPKCVAVAHTIPFLGSLVSADGVRTDPAKVAAVIAWKGIEDLTQLRQFVGKANHYKKFIRGSLTS